MRGFFPKAHGRSRVKGRNVAASTVVGDLLGASVLGAEGKHCFGENCDDTIGRNDLCLNFGFKKSI